MKALAAESVVWEGKRCFEVKSVLQEKANVEFSVLHRRRHRMMTAACDASGVTIEIFTWA
jgi:hypothetical protein